MLQPASPVRRGRIVDVGLRRAASSRRWRHPPAHQDEFTLGVSVADDRGGVIEKHARHRRQVPHVSVHQAKKVPNGFVQRALILVALGSLASRASALCGNLGLPDQESLVGKTRHLSRS